VAKIIGVSGSWLVSIFYRWISSFFNIIFEEIIFSLMHVLSAFVESQMANTLEFNHLIAVRSWNLWVCVSKETTTEETHAQDAQSSVLHCVCLIP
jgi:hypothetical protein